MKEVRFQFSLDEKVKIEPTGQEGIITMCGCDDAGIKYFVQGMHEGQWWAERFLVKA